MLGSFAVLSCFASKRINRDEVERVRAMVAQANLDAGLTTTSHTVFHALQHPIANRCTHILPWDHSRVELGPRPGSHSSYINASHLLLSDRAGAGAGTNYIATQMLLPNTLADFWWMVWQQSSNTIVSITSESEWAEVCSSVRVRCSVCALITGGTYPTIEHS